MANKDNIPVVWIDHHCMETKPENDWVSYYNPYYYNKTSEPVSYICYKIAGKKEDICIALIGCISDCYVPDFYSEFEAKYPELGKKNSKSAFDLLYNSEIGKIARVLDFSLKDTVTNVVKMLKFMMKVILDFSLKDTVTNVVKMLKFMMKVKGPMDILEENFKTKQILKRYEQINSKYQELIEKARKLAKGRLLYFQYGGSLSLSSNLANQLIYEFSDKVVVVVYMKEDVANISVRGAGNIRALTLKAIEGIEGATGGGHEHATGAKMDVGDLDKFRKKVEGLVVELVEEI